jgi:hypothetical protein
MPQCMPRMWPICAAALGSHENEDGHVTRNCQYQCVVPSCVGIYSVSMSGAGSSRGANVSSAFHMSDGLSLYSIAATW